MKRGDTNGLDFSKELEILVVHDKYFVEQFRFKSMRTLKSDKYIIKIKLKKVNENWSILIINYDINGQVGLVEIIGLRLELEHIHYIDLRDIENNIKIKTNTFSYILDIGNSRDKETRFCLENGRILITK